MIGEDAQSSKKSRFFFGCVYILPNHDLPPMSQWVGGWGPNTFRNSSAASHKSQLHIFKVVCCTGSYTCYMTYDICILHTKGNVRSFHQPPSHDLSHDSKLCPPFLENMSTQANKQACLKHGTLVIWINFCVVEVLKCWTSTGFDNELIAQSLTRLQCPKASAITSGCSESCHWSIPLVCRWMSVRRHCNHIQHWC